MKPFVSLGYRGQVGRLRRLALVALAEYDIDPVDIRLLTHLENPTFRVTDRAADRYLLRIHRVIGRLNPPRSLAEVSSELEWLAAIDRDTSLAVPVPVPRRDGELVTVARVDGVPEARLCVVNRWVEGRFINRRLTARHLEAVGRFAACLHRHGRSFRPPDGFIRPRIADAAPAIQARAVAAVESALGPGHAEAVSGAFASVRAAERELGDGPETFGLIHADLHQENYLFAGDEVRAIDFDDCGFGFFVYDLAVTLSEIEWYPNYLPMRDALLRGYRQVADLPAAHERLIAPFLAFRNLQLALWFIEQREHPGFPDWEPEARELLDLVRDRLENGDSAP